MINHLVFFGPIISFSLKNIPTCVAGCHWPQRGHLLTEARFPFCSNAREKVILHTIFTCPQYQQWCYITASWVPCRFLKRMWVWGVGGQWGIITSPSVRCCQGNWERKQSSLKLFAIWISFSCLLSIQILEYIHNGVPWLLHSNIFSTQKEVIPCKFLQKGYQNCPEGLT